MGTGRFLRPRMNCTGLRKSWIADQVRNDNLAVALPPCRHPVLDTGSMNSGSHHPSLSPKYRHSLRSVSAVIARLPATISPMRCGGTPMSLAKRYLVKPSGFKNSSSSISPGETGGTVRIFKFAKGRTFNIFPAPNTLAPEFMCCGSSPACKPINIASLTPLFHEPQTLFDAK